MVAVANKVLIINHEIAPGRTTAVFVDEFLGS
jgi:hypothetical protein